MVKMIRFGLYEAFRAGMAGKMMPKITSVLSKRIGQELSLSPMPWDYVSPEGHFTSFYMFFGSGSALRLNFLRDKSDRIVSVDYFTEPSETPKYTIDLNGFNIIQVIDLVADAVTGEYFDYSRDELVASFVDDNSKLKEGRKKFTDFLDEWFMAKPDVLEEIKSGRVQIPALYKQFSDWMENNGNKPPKFIQSFQTNLKKYLDNNNIRNSIPDITVRRGQRSTMEVSTSEENAFNEVIVENEHMIVFDMMEGYVEDLAHQTKFYMGIIIYGQAGIGKTKMVRDVLKRENATYKFFSGGIAGFTGLLQILWDYRGPENIIVLDDNDSILKNETGVNMLKAALGEDNRWVSYIKKKKAGASTQEEVDPEILADFSGESGIDFETMPEEFEFLGRMIFISNLVDFPPALLSRCPHFGINMTVEQTLELIKKNLNGVFSEYPEVTMEAKQAVFDFLLEKSGSLKSMDFRQFKHALLPYLSGRPNWKDWVLVQLRRS